MMDDADREHDVEFVATADRVRAAVLDAHRGKGRQRAPRGGERALVHVDGERARRAVAHRPVGIAPHAAAHVEEREPAPILRR